METNLKRIVRIIIVFSAIIVVVATLFTILLKNVESQIKQSTLEDKFALKNYTELKYVDSAVDSTDNVKFYAFFTKDLKNSSGTPGKDGIAEKYDGTCNYIKDNDTLFIDINVLTEGHFENGEITINADNFKYSMYMIADSVVLTKDYISDDVKKIDINRIDAGTQKIMFGKINSNIGNDITNYSKKATVTLTGTYIDDEGNRTPIEKTCVLNIDWYADINTSVYGSSNQTYYYDNMSSNQISFTISTRESKNELLLKDSVVTAEIPLLNGYQPTSVVCSNSNVVYEYDSNTRIITITKSSTVNSNGIITSSLSRSNSFTVKVTYPDEAYESISEDTNITIPIKGQYVGYNNPDDIFNSQYSYLANVSLSGEPKSSYPSNIAEGRITVLFRQSPKIEEPTPETPGVPVEPVVPVAPVVRKYNKYFGVTIQNKAYITSPISGYAISKQNWLDYLEELSSEGKYNYIVRWYAYSGNVEKINSYVMSETRNDNNESYGDKFDENIIGDYTANTGIYFGNPTSVLGVDGEISVYNDDTNECIHTFTKDNWNMYSASNPYTYSEPVKHIRVETTEPNKSTTFSAYHLKQLDLEKLKTDYTRDDILGFSKLYTYMTGTAGLEENETSTSNCLDYAYLISNSTPSSFEVIISNKIWNLHRYVMSKQNLINYKNDSSFEGNFEYIVNWKAHSGNIETVNSFVMTETINGENGQYGDKIDSIIFDEYTNNKGIYFSNATTALGTNGEIRVYDNDTNELIHTFTSAEWGKYTISNPYRYSETIKHIRIETSSPQRDTTLNVYNVKEFDYRKIAQDYTREEIYKFNLMTTYLTGRAILKYSGEKIGKDTDSVYFIANSNLNYFNVTISSKRYVNRDFSGYAISKQELVYLYNDPSYVGNYQYTVHWGAYSGNIETIKSYTMAETANGENEEYGDKIDSNVFDEYIYNRAIYFSDATTALGEDGEIRVYNDDTSELIHTFTSTDWAKYSASKPYTYDEGIKHIRVETSSPAENETLHVYNIKEFNAEKIVENFSKEDVYNWNRISTYLTGTAELKYSGGKVSNSSDSAYIISNISNASLDVETKVVKTTDTINEKIYIDTIYSNWGDSYWQDGQFIIELPKDIISVNVNNVNISSSAVKILGYDIFRTDGKNFIKIITKNDIPTTYRITIDCDITPDSTIQTSSDSFKLYAYNKASNDYYSMGEDLYDVDSDDNTGERVGVASTNIDYIAPTVIVTLETVSDYDKDKNITVAPNVADVERANKQATINISLMNNYPFTATGIKVLGRIPFEGNKYVISGKDMKSEFNTTMTSEGIHGTTQTLDSAIIVYYSESGNATKDLTDENNGWKLADEVSDFSKIKSYLIDLQEYGVSNIPVYFNYNIKIPDGIDYNQVSYSNHAVYYDFVTEGGRISFKTEPAKVGVRIVDKFNLDITKYKTNSDKMKIPSVTYNLMYKEKDTEGRLQNKSRILTTNSDGKIEIKDLYLDVEYTLKEIVVPDMVELNSDEIIFKINKDGQPEVTNNVKSYEFVNDETLKIEIEDEVKYKLKIGKFKKGEDTIINTVKFNLEDEDGNNTVVRTTKGIAEINGLSLNKVYTLTESTVPISIEKNQGEFKFELVRNSESKKIEVVVENNTLIIENPIITDGEEILVPEIYVRVEDEIKYNLNLSKIDLDGNNADGVEFVIKGKGIRDEGEKYTVYNGRLNVPNLYVNETYVLEETKAIGYYLDKTKENTISFKVVRENEVLMLQDFIVGNGLTVPDGYTATVTEDGLTANLNVIILNEKIPTYSLKIKKENDEGDILPGAQFKLTCVDYGVEKDITIDENGEWTFAELYLFEDGKPFEGLYMLEETYAPEGYRLDTTVWKFYVSKGTDDKLVVNTVEGDSIVKNIIEEDGNSRKDFVLTENEVTVTIVNKPIFTLTKYGDNDELLPNTLFEITDLEGNSVQGSDDSTVGKEEVVYTDLTFKKSQDYMWTQDENGTWKSENCFVANSESILQSNSFIIKETCDFSFEWSVSSQGYYYDYLQYIITNEDTGATKGSARIGGTSLRNYKGKFNIQ